MVLRMLALSLFALNLAACASGPRYADASAMVGKPAPGWGRLDWVGGKRLSLDDLKGQVVVVHWWTDGCPDCVVNLDMMNRLAATYGSKGLQVIGMYFPEPKGDVPISNITEVSQILNARFPVGVDEDWEVLERWWLRHGTTGVMTPTFVLDGRGIVRGVLAAKRITHDDARRLETMVVDLLAESK